MEAEVERARQLIVNERGIREAQCMDELLVLLAKHNCELRVSALHISRDGRLNPQITISAKDQP